MFTTRGPKICRSRTSSAAPRLQIHGAPPPVIALLKMVPWLDRPADRERGLEDLSHLLDEFVEPHADAFYDPEVSRRASQPRAEHDSLLTGPGPGSLIETPGRPVADNLYALLQQAHQLATTTGAKIFGVEIAPCARLARRVKLLPHREWISAEGSRMEAAP
jgi:hypothetical protein